MSRVKFSDRQQADLTEMQALADSAEDNSFALVNALLFSSDYRVDGGLVAPDSPASGIVLTDPGVFVKADGKFYKMATEATANILTGVENQSANVWGTGQAADLTDPRKDIIIVSHQFVESDVQVKNFIDDTVSPPVQYTQNITTRKNSAPIFAVLHGVPSPTPSEPAIPSGFMKLATVDVAAGATVINVGDITNNLNIDIKSLEKLQQASQAQAAFSDLLHSDGVYAGVLNALGVSETTPQSMAVSVNTGVALKDGVTARVSTATTVPIDAASFFPVVAEGVTFNVDTKTLNTNGTPPHKIRAGTVVVPTKTEGVDYSVNYTLGTITRLGGGSIAPGGSITVSYDYYLPRIDRIEVLVSNSTPQSVMGTPAQAPVAPAASPNAVTLAYVTVGEGVTIIVTANISDQRIYLPDMDEVVAARGSYLSLLARFIADEAAIAAESAARALHEADDVTSLNTVHGIRQGTGNGFDADTVDGQHAAAILARANHTGVQAPATISPQGTGSGLDSDTVDGIHAAVAPTPMKLVPLDATGKLPVSTLPSFVGNSIKQKLVVKKNTALPLRKLDISAEILSVQGTVLSSVSTVVDFEAAVGAGGLDTGVEASSTWYAVFVICNDDGTLVNALLSTSTTPILPLGYTKYVRVAWTRNNGSSNIVPFYQAAGIVIYDDPNTNIAYTTSTNGAHILTQSLSAWVPPGSEFCTLDAGIGLNNTSTAAGASSSGSLSVRADATCAYRSITSCVCFNPTTGSIGGVTSSGAVVRVSAAQAIDISLALTFFESGGGTVYVAGYHEV